MRPILCSLVFAVALEAHIDLLIPAETTAGAAGFTLRAIGTEFEASEFLIWNGTPLQTTFVSDLELRATIPASFLLNPGTVQVTLSGFNTVRFVINPPPVITTPSPLPNGAPATSYARLLERTGGTAPFRWSVSSGTLPEGLTLNETSGLLSGTPRAAGTSNFTIRLIDSVNIATTKAFALTIGQAEPATPSCSVSPQNTYLAAHHPIAHRIGGRVPDHTIRVAASAGSMPIVGATVDLTATRPVFPGTTARAVTDSNGIATFTINPPAPSGFDQTTLNATVVRGAETLRCAGTVLAGIGVLSSIRERFGGAEAQALARLQNRSAGDAETYSDELQRIVEADPGLQDEAVEVLRRFGPALDELLAGMPIRVRGSEATRLRRFFETIGPRASPALRQAIAGWTRDLFEVRERFRFADPPKWRAARFVIGTPPAAASSRKLTFEENFGQAGAGTRYLAKGAAHRALFTGTGLTLQAPLAEPVHIGFPGARFSRAELLEPDGGRSHVLQGADPARWRRNIPHYQRLRYSNLVAGVDLVFYGDEGRLRYDFVVAPRANPNRIAVSFDGVREIEPLPTGELLLHYAGGDIRLGAPYVYQNRDGHSSAIAARYVSRGGNRVGFELASYDRSLPVVIDPVLSYASFAGGNGEDSGVAVQVDAQGSAHVAGFSGERDIQAFVTKFSPDGSRILYTTYFGGSGLDVATGLALDAQGNVYVCGSTSSENFPVPGGLQRTYSGGPTPLEGDGFLVKLSADGASILYGSYIGGSAGDTVKGVGLDRDGNVFLAGFTSSLDFPVRGAIQATQRGGVFAKSDAFVMKLNPPGNALLYSTYLGGSGDDSGLGLAVDAAGNAYVTGVTYSTNFPVTNSYQRALRGASDVFVAKLNPAGSALVYSTYIGGTSADSGVAIAIDAAGAAYVAGATGSGNFPVTSAVQPRSGSVDGLGFDGFAAKLNPAGDQLVFATFLGGSGTDLAHGIAVDGRGSAVIVGETDSANFPALNALRVAGAGSDSFVVKLTPAGSAIEYASYLGGQSLDAAAGVAVDAAGNVYVTGSTMSPDNAATPGAARTQLAGRSDAFAIKIAPGASRPLAAAVSAASLLRGEPLAKDSIVSVYGTNFTTGAGETAVQVRDSAGTVRTAELYFVSASQINFILPAATAAGVGEVLVQRGGQLLGAAPIRVTATAPGLFTANAAGTGAPLGWAIREGADPVALAAGEVDVSSPVFLTLFGTGIRGRLGLDSVQITIGGVSVPVTYAGAQGEFPAFDQVNAGPLPAALQGRGTVELQLAIGGVRANPVTIQVK